MTYEDFSSDKEWVRRREAFLVDMDVLNDDVKIDLPDDVTLKSCIVLLRMPQGNNVIVSLSFTGHPLPKWIEVLINQSFRKHFGPQSAK